MLFVFVGLIYLYYFQGDLLSMAQHVLSHGRTTYHLRVYTIIIMSLLTALGLIISHYVYLPIRARALAWFPSCWILGLLTKVSLRLPGFDNTTTSNWWFVVGGIIFVLSMVLAHFYNQKRNENSSFSNLMAPNLAILALSFSFIFATGNTNRRIHDELRLEGFAFQENFDEIIRLTDQKDTLSRPMTYIRAYALSRQEKLGDELFAHQCQLGSDALLPSLIDSLRPNNMPALMRMHLGGMPLHDMSATNFFRYITADSLCSAPARQYLLCALLLDRNIDEFRDSLVSFYVPKDSLEKFQKKPVVNRWAPRKPDAPHIFRIENLPRHFAEALVLVNYKKTMDEATESSIHSKYVVEPSDSSYTKMLDLYLSLRDREHSSQEVLDSISAFQRTYWHYYYK